MIVASLSLPAARGPGSNGQYGRRYNEESYSGGSSEDSEESDEGLRALIWLFVMKVKAILLQTLTAHGTLSARHLTEHSAAHAINQ